MARVSAAIVESARIFKVKPSIRVPSLPLHMPRLKLQIFSPTTKHQRRIFANRLLESID
ncbi:FPL domain-containing protein [Psidium guajava]|nr:FPL domain-containing protein [Psidium guajava]